MPSRPSKASGVISRRRKRGNVRFRMRDGRGRGGAGKSEPEQWCKRYVRVRQRGARIVASPRHGWTAALREITSHARERPRNRNSPVSRVSPRLSVFLSRHRLPPHLPPPLPRPPAPLSLRGIEGLAMSFLSTCGRRSATCLPAVSCFGPFAVASLFTLPGDRRSRFENTGEKRIQRRKIPFVFVYSFHLVYT